MKKNNDSVISDTKTFRNMFPANSISRLSLFKRMTEKDAESEKIFLDSVRETMCYNIIKHVFAEKADRFPSDAEFLVLSDFIITYSDDGMDSELRNIEDFAERISENYLKALDDGMLNDIEDIERCNPNDIIYFQ